MKLLSGIAVILLLASCGNNASDKGVGTDSQENGTSLSGEQLFKINCTQCHMANKDFVGPNLVGVESRWKDRQLLYAYVKNSQEVIQSDEYAKNLFLKWKQVPMLPFPNLTEKQVDAIFAYVNETGATK
jgi:mono/diheme cytochrome c family protein